MAKSRAVPSQLTERYAVALFELAEENKSLAKVEADIDALANMLSESEDFNLFVNASSISSSRRMAVIADLAKKGKFQKETTNFLNVLAGNGRFEALADMITGFRKLLATKRNEVTAQVQSVYELTATQQKALAKELSTITGKNVVLDASLNSELIGGMIVTVGSTRIDSSVLGRLNRLNNAMSKNGTTLNDNIETLNKKEA